MGGNPVNDASDSLVGDKQIWRWTLMKMKARRLRRDIEVAKISTRLSTGWDQFGGGLAGPSTNLDIVEMSTDLNWQGCRRISEAEIGVEKRRLTIKSQDSDDANKSDGGELEWWVWSRRDLWMEI